MNNNNILRNIKEQLDLIAFQAKRAIQYVMETDKGINDKTGTNTLIDSNLYEQIDVDYDDWGLVSIMVNDYIDYVESGRTPHNWLDPSVLIDWANRKGIPSDNNTLYAIANSIWKYGITARPIMQFAFEEWDKYWDDWGNEIFDILCENLNDFFNS